MADQDGGENPTPSTPPTPPPAAAQTDKQMAAMSALKAAQEAIARAKSGVMTPTEPDPEPAPAAPVAVAPPPPAPPPQPAASPFGAPQPLPVPTFSMGSEAKAPEGIDLLSDVNLNVKIELGRTKMLVEDVLRLTEGSVVELDKLAGDPVDVFVNDRQVARGEVLVLNDSFCIRVSEILNSPQMGGT